QHDAVYTARRLVREIGHLGETKCRSKIGAGREIQILAALVECSIPCIAHPVGDLAYFAGLERVDKDSPQMIVDLLDVPYPTTVGRPERLHDLRVQPVWIFVDFNW